MGLRGPTPKDLSGKKFGKLLVDAYAGPRPNNQGALWHVVCDCGVRTTAYASVLLQGKKLSCGCHYNSPEHIAARATSCRKPDASYRHAYNQYKWHAKAAKRTFDLTREEFKELTAKNCFYCGCPPCGIKVPHGNDYVTHLANGIDRVDSKLGYVLSNCVPCCKACNWMKNDSTLQEFLDRCRTITERFPNVASVTG